MAAAKPQRELRRGAVVFLAVVAAVVIGSIVAVLIRMFAVVIVAAAVGAIVGILITRRRATRHAVAAAEAAKPPTLNADAVLDRLIRRNIIARTSGCPVAVVVKLEELIDVIRGMLPDIAAGRAGSDVVWIVDRASNAYLAAILDTYLRLTPAEQASQAAEVVTALEAMRRDLASAAACLREDRVSDLVVAVETLKLRFGSA